MKKALIFSGVKWNAPWQRHHIITKSLLESNYKVDFVEGVISSKITKEKILAKINKPKNQHISSNPTPINLKIIKSLPTPHLKILEYFYTKNILSQIELYYDLVIIYIPRKEILNILNKIKYKKLIYDCVRDFENWHDVDKQVLDSENHLIKISNEIWCDSYWLEEKLSKKINTKIRRIYPTIPKNLLLQINDETFISKNRIKNILYFGTISDHVDLSVFTHLNDLGYSLYFIGTSEKELPSFFNCLGYISNQNELLLKISSICDAIIIPYKGNMDGVVPSKINICLASGKPIIISDFFDSKIISKNKLLSDSIYTYNNKSEIQSLIHKIQTRKNSKKRIQDVKYFLNENIESKFKEFL